MNSIPAPAPLSTDHDQYMNWELFRSQWGNYEIATGLDEKEDKRRVATLLSVMGKDCYRIFEHLHITSEQRKKVGSMLSKLEEYFKPKRNVIYEHYIFHTTQQEPSETISEYVTKLRRLAASCDFGTLKEDVIRDRIETSDEEVRPCLLRNPSLNLNTCIEMCRSSELAIMQLQRIAPVRRHPMAEENVHWTSTKRRQTNGKDGDQCQYCDGERHMSKEKYLAWGETCGKCKKRNNFARVC